MKDRRSKTMRFSADTLNALRIVLDYLIDSERNHYEEYVSDKFGERFEKNTGKNGKSALKKSFYNRPDIDHVYAYARRVRDKV